MVRKNWDPPVSRPAFAIENIPGLSCFFANADASQGIFQPGPPVPALPLFASLECGHPPWIMKSLITLWKCKPS